MHDGNKHKGREGMGKLGVFLVMTLCLLFLLPFMSFAGYEGPVTAKITRVTSYTQYGALGGADVIIAVDANSPSCPGDLWLSGAAAGFKQNLATIMMAVSLGKNIEYHVETNNNWPGSSAPVCHLYQISITN
jgi:hypothetical protein